MVKKLITMGINNVVIVKVGGSSITDKGKIETLDVDAIERISKILASTVGTAYLSQDSDNEIDNDRLNDENPLSIVVVHGAGSFGHQIARENGLEGKSKPPPPRDDDNDNDNVKMSSRRIKQHQNAMTGLARTRAR